MKRQMNLKDRKKQRQSSVFLYRPKLVFLIVVFLLLGIFITSRAEISSFFPRAQSSSSSVITHGPLVGAVTDSEATIWIRAVFSDVNGATPFPTTRTALTSVPNNDIQVRLATSQETLLNAKNSQVASAELFVNTFNQVSFVSPTELPWDNTWKSTVKGLSPNTKYYVDVIYKGLSQLSYPYPSFKTFVTKGQNALIQFAVLTDFGSLHSNSLQQDPLDVQTFRKIYEENPPVDFVVIGGDFWHTDTDSTEGKRTMYKNMYSLNSLNGPYNDFVNYILKNYALIHFWDDHDIGLNNSDKTYIHRKQSYQVLQEFFPVYPLPANADGPNGQWRNGDWQKFSYGQVDFFVLDGRSQRDPNYTTDGKDKSMLDGDNLGAIGQLEWLKSNLNSSSAKWKIIFSPLVFNPTLKKGDAFSGFKNEHNSILKYLQNNKIKGVVVISGDAHGGAIDNGQNSGVPEMLVPGPNMKMSCFTAQKIGDWSEGVYGALNTPKGCRGYGYVRIAMNPDRVVLIVKDDKGNNKLKYRYFLNPQDEGKFPNVVD